MGEGLTLPVLPAAPFRPPDPGFSCAPPHGRQGARSLQFMTNATDTPKPRKYLRTWHCPGPATGTRGSFEPGQPAAGLVREGLTRPTRIDHPGTLGGSWAAVKSGPGSGRLERCRLRTICSQAGEGSPDMTGGGRR
jgi:hypothetical protein